MYLPHEQQRSYYNHAIDFSEKEHEKITEYSNWLPPNIIDAHAHSNLPEHVEDIPNKTFYHMMSTFPSYSIEESKHTQELLHPLTNVRTLRFAHVFKGIAHRAANEYLLSNVSVNDRAALYGLPEDIPYTVDMLSDPRVSALKMYYSYIEPTAERIYDIFKPEILEVAELQGVPIVLHSPKVITESVEDIITMKTDFPNLKVSIAHLGSSKFDIPGLQDAFDAIAESTDVSMDTALNPSAEVTQRAITTFGVDRILYGTDEPLNLLRSVPYIHPSLGQRITTSYYYHWQDLQEHSEYNHLAGTAVHSHWLCLDALKSAITKLPSHEQEAAKQKIFYENAAKLFGFE